MYKSSSSRRLNSIKSPSFLFPSGSRARLHPSNKPISPEHFTFAKKKFNKNRTKRRFLKDIDKLSKRRKSKEIDSSYFLNLTKIKNQRKNQRFKGFEGRRSTNKGILEAGSGKYPIYYRNYKKSKNDHKYQKFKSRVQKSSSPKKISRICNKNTDLMTRQKISQNR